ncbi:MAG: hypothetical protein FGM61_13590, partial [Sediminibacterium sp.]|nr:hypothetical protein [Sediminibacterium sp.]
MQQQRHKRKSTIADGRDTKRFWGLLNFEKLIAFLYWVYYLLSSKPVFRTYKGGHKGIFNIGLDNFKVGLLSDWASATDVSQKAANQLGTKDCSVTIHMGDIYYVGHKEEILENFCPEKGDWNYGSLGSLAIPGNHEYFSDAKGFYDVLLPLMGIMQNNIHLQQESGFFCLENEFWRIIALDTGYHSVKDSIIKLTLWQDAHLDKKLIQWLKETVQIEKDHRGIIIVTHHQPKSGFEEIYPRITEQLTEIIGTSRKVLWFWGHEHRLAFFGVDAKKDQLKAFGRCIGHGGMPVVIGKNDQKFLPNENAAEQSLVAYDERDNNIYGTEFQLTSKMLGFNGYATLTLDRQKLCVEYFDIENNDPLVRENWEVDLSNGALTGSIIENKPGILKLYRSVNLEQA